MASSDKNSSGLDGAGGWGESNSSQGWGGGGGSSDRNPSGLPGSFGWGMPAAGGSSGARTSISASEQSKSAWGQMLDRISAAVKSPKNIGAVVGFAIGGPYYGLALAGPTSWAFDKMFGEPKDTPKTASGWTSHFAPANAYSQEDFQKDSGAAYQSWQSKMQEKTTRQTAWSSYIASLAPKKSAQKQEEWGLLS